MGLTASKLPGYETAPFRDHGADLRDGQDLEPDHKPLYALQSAVPRLPLPRLTETFDTLLKSVQPLLSEAEFAELEQKLAEFGKPCGLAHRLQQRLQALQTARPDSSWLSEMWNDCAYLAYRDAVVWNVSYYLQFKDEGEWSMCSPIHRAARFVSHALSFREHLISGDLSPDMNRGRPMCMSQYKFLFNACRIPGKKKDFVRTYAPDLFGHILVVRKNRFYVVDVLDPATGLALDTATIAASLASVVANADGRRADSHGVGILTAMDRDSWYADRQHLIGKLKPAECQANRDALALVESSILAVCLDDQSPQTRNEVARALLHSDGRNRFWDKSIQVVFFANGKGGCICEHSMTDGTTTAAMINYVLEQMSGDAPARETAQASSPNTPQSVDFVLDQHLQTAVAESGARFDALMASKDLDSIVIQDYGKEAIKSLGMSPDAFVQQAIQLASFRTFGCFRGTYESTQTRSFLHGRTEVTRSVTSESVAFCKAIESGTVSRQECEQLLRAATTAHSAYSARAAQGHGCDRHLLGLKMMMRHGESADLYSDPGYNRACTWLVSTSALAGRFIDGWGFGEVVAGGIGVGYQISSESLAFTVCSGSGRAEEMTANLERSLRDMQRLLHISEARG